MNNINEKHADEILAMAKTDQEMRNKVIDKRAGWDSSVDKANQTRLIQIVNKYGWPTISMVGAEASNAAWLLVQHAPDLRFMELCLELMESLPGGEINPINIAYLKDRVLMMNGKPQIYSTQFHGTGKNIHVAPIEDIEHVNERITSVGLGSFSEDEARLRQLYQTDKT